MSIQSASICGGNPSRGCRADNDFYATPPETTKALMIKENFIGSILEPACGNGMMSDVIKRYNQNVTSSDIIDRGYGITADFFGDHPIVNKLYCNVITNPPFYLFQDFVEKSLRISTNKVAIFGKLHALEGAKRSRFLEATPLKYVYVFRNRQSTWRNGNEKDENGKPWQTTIAFAWFVWDKSYSEEPVVRWLP